MSEAPRQELGGAPTARIERQLINLRAPVSLSPISLTPIEHSYVTALSSHQYGLAVNHRHPTYGMLAQSNATTNVYVHILDKVRGRGVLCGAACRIPTPALFGLLLSMIGGLCPYTQTSAPRPAVLRRCSGSGRAAAASATKPSAAAQCT